MSIIGNLKDLIFGAKPEPKFSERDFSAAKQRAETLVREFNESLVIAGQSKSKRIRDERLQIARQRLVELNKLANKFPFLHLQNLQAVEASIIAVEAETSLLPYNDAADSSVKDVLDKVQPERSGQGRQRLSTSDEQAILMCIQSCFRVVNESIEIARKSKNLETKLSRLGVARDRLKEARRQASQFSLEVGGFVEAEAEINRIDEAIKTGTPAEIAGMQQIDVNTAFSSAARNLLMEATALKKKKKYIEACEKLREAYSADGAENLMIEDRLRLPMYLQLAGKNDEGWDELNRLLARYTDQFSQPRIEHQMNVFLRKENNKTASNPVRVILRGDNQSLEATPDASGKTINEMQNAPSPVGKTVGELQSEPMSAWGNDDIITGLEFSATVQLRTPLRVLLRHGEVHTDRNTEPPEIVREGWEGIWLPKLKSWSDLIEDKKWAAQLDKAERQNPGGMASDIGTIRAEDYLPFLIAVREIVELRDSIESRIKQLRDKLMEHNWQTNVEMHGGVDKIIGNFFPRFIDTIPKINDATIAELFRLDLDTPNRIAAVSDETLLGINGIGPAKLKALRERCACITENRDADRFESESLVR